MLTCKAAAAARNEISWQRGIVRWTLDPFVACATKTRAEWARRDGYPDYAGIKIFEGTRINVI